MTWVKRPAWKFPPAALRFSAADYVNGLLLSSIAYVLVLVGLILADRFMQRMRGLQIRLAEPGV